MCNLKGCEINAERYLGNLTIKPPILSPIRQNFNGFPSLLIQVGDHEILLSDSTRLAERVREAEVNVTLEVWDDMWHAFQLFAGFVPEANQAIDNIGKFINENIG